MTEDDGDVDGECDGDAEDVGRGVMRITSSEVGRGVLFFVSFAMLEPSAECIVPLADV